MISMVSLITHSERKSKYFNYRTTEKREIKKSVNTQNKTKLMP